MTFGLQYGLWILPYGLQILKLKCFCLAVYGHWKMDFLLSIVAYGLLFMVFGKWIMESTLWIHQYVLCTLSHGLCILPVAYGFCNMGCRFCHMDYGFWSKLFLACYLWSLENGFFLVVAYGLLLLVFRKWIVESTLRILQYGLNILQYGMWILSYGLQILKFNTFQSW